MRPRLSRNPVFNHAPPLHPVRGAYRLVLGACLVVACLPARAFDDDVINVTLNASDRYDSNLFRLPDDTDPFGNGRRSAYTRTGGVGLQIDKTYGLQHFTVSGNVSRVTYDPYAALDTTSKVINAQWAWALTSAITGNVIYSRIQSPNNFSDTGVQTAPNERKLETREFDLDLRPGAALHPRLSVITQEDKSQQTTFNRQNASTSSLQGGLIYEFRSGNTTELYFRRGRGDYTNVDADFTVQLAARFEERETGLNVHYRSTGASTFDGQFGYLTRDHANFASRNFSGPVGQLTYNYSITGKTSIQIQAIRSLYSAQTLISSYTSDDTISIGPIWSATSKITVRPSYSVSRREFRGAIVPVADELRMTLRTASLTIDWNLYRNITLTFGASKESRSSNDAQFRFDDRSASVSAAMRF